MNDCPNEYEIRRKREYHRKWRAEHQESVRAAQIRYWQKQAELTNVNMPTVAAESYGEREN